MFQLNIIEDFCHEYGFIIMSTLHLQYSKEI